MATNKIYDYVVVLCEADGHEVKAVRYDGYERRTDVYEAVRKDHPDWVMKGVFRLYDHDFVREENRWVP